jgi:hypothetical protein
MKILHFLIIGVLLLINTPLIGQGASSLLKIKIQSGHLNIRKEPTKDAAVVGKVPMDNYVHFLMDYENGWVKMKYVFQKNGDQMESIIGWVSSDFVECPMIKSKLLEHFENENGDGISLESAQGTIMELGQDNNAYVYVDGKELTLMATDATPTIYRGNGYVIETILFNSDSGYEWSQYNGFIRIQKGNEIENIFVIGSFSL